MTSSVGPLPVCDVISRATSGSAPLSGQATVDVDARRKIKYTKVIEATIMVVIEVGGWSVERVAEQTDNRTRVQAVIRRGIRSGLCEQHHKTVQELVEDADDKLFTSVMYNKQHVLHRTLPGTTDAEYHLRPRPTTLLLFAPSGKSGPKDQVALH